VKTNTTPRISHKIFAKIVLFSLLVSIIPMQTRVASASGLSSETLPPEITIPVEWSLHSVEDYSILGKNYRVRYYSYPDTTAGYYRTIPVITIIDGSNEIIVQNIDELDAVALYALWQYHDPYLMDLSWDSLASDWLELANANDPTHVDFANALIFSGKVLLGVSIDMLFPSGNTPAALATLSNVAKTISLGADAISLYSDYMSFPSDRELQAVVRATIDLDPTQEDNMDAALDSITAIQYLQRGWEGIANDEEKFQYVVKVLENMDAIPFTWVDAEGTVVTVSNPQAQVRAGAVVVDIVVSKQFDDLGRNAKAAIVSNQWHALTNYALANSMASDQQSLQTVSDPDDLIKLVASMERKADHFYKVAHEMTFVYHHYLSVINNNSWAQDWVVPDQDLADLADQVDQWKEWSDDVVFAIKRITQNYEYFLTLSYPDFAGTNIPPADISGYVKENGTGLSSVVVTAGTYSDTTNSSGYYEIVDVPAGTYPVVPIKTGYSFYPVSRTASLSGSDLSMGDFIATADAPPPNPGTIEISNSVEDWFESTGWYDTTVLTVRDGGTGGTHYNSLLRFNDFSAIPNNAVIKKAELWLYLNLYSTSNPSSVTIAAHEFNSNWTQNGTPPRPYYYGTASIDTATVTSSTSWAKLDITDMVKDWASGGDNNGVLITPEPYIPGYYINIRFNSSTTTNGSLVRPKLVVEYGFPDVVAGSPKPDNGNTNPPFCVGQEVEWYTTTTNIGNADVDDVQVDYYLGTSPSDYSNEFNTDYTSTISANGGSASEHDPNPPFTTNDIGTRYINIWVNNNGEIPESNFSNNKASYGPFNIIQCNTPPDIANVPDRSLNEDASLNNTIDLWAYTSDQESLDSSLDFNINNSPNPSAGVSIDGNRYIDINPDSNWYGFTDVEIIVIDPDGSYDIDTFRVTVNSVNDLPTIVSVVPDQSSTGSNPISIDLTPYESDIEDAGVSLDWSVAGENNVVVTGENSDNDQLIFTPDQGFTGSDVVTLHLTDSDGGEDTQDITLTWQPVSGSEIDIQRPAGTSIPDNSTDDIGDKNVGPVSLEYTIDNIDGTNQLDVSGVTPSNLSNVSNFTVDTTLPLNIPAGSSDILQISFDVDAEGAFSLDLDIANTDSNENPYDIHIAGMGIPQIFDNFITFDQFPDSTPIQEDIILQGDEFISQGVTLSGPSAGSYYCDGTSAAIRVGWDYNYLTTSTPTDVTHCNTIPIKISFEEPVREVNLQFSGASTEYVLSIFDENGNLIADVSQMGECCSQIFDIGYISSNAYISYITFGYQAALTKVKSIGYLLWSGVPLPPEGIIASDGTHTDKIELNWDSSSYPDYYEVWRHDANNSSEAVLIDGNVIGSAYNDTNANEGVTYYYWLKACNLAGCSDFSNPDDGYRRSSGDAYEPDDAYDQATTIIPDVPQEHSIDPVGDEDWVKFTLSQESEVVLETSGPSGDTRMWLYNNGLTQIEYNDDGGTNLFSHIDRICDTDALPAGTYYVKIDEYGNNNEIPSYQITLDVTACETPPNPPGSFNKNTPSNGVTNQSINPTLSWGTSSGTTTYYYCYDTSNDDACSNWTSNGSSTSINLNGLTYSTTYYWHVRAANSSGTTYSNGSSTAFWSFTTASMGVDVYIGGGAPIGSYAIPSGGQESPSFPGTFAGPVEVVSTNGQDILVSERQIYGSSFTETLGIPDAQLTTDYWFPWYDGMTMSTWISIGAPDTNSGDAQVDIYIGGTKMNTSPYVITPGGQISPSFPGTFAGPVEVVSTNGQDILVSERQIYGSSFTETLGVPDSQLTTDYWFPWYDGLTMSTWISIGTPDTNSADAQVDIYIGGTKMNTSPYVLAPGEQVSPSFAGTFAGPVEVVSTNGQDILVSERQIYGSSFTETLGMPADQLTTDYWFSWYDGMTMSTWISIGAPDTNSGDAQVDIYIGGAKVNTSPYVITPGGQISPSFAGTFAGPVEVVSTNGSVSGRSMAVASPKPWEFLIAN
jgi:hypothetical protein